MEKNETERHVIEDLIMDGSEIKLTFEEGQTPCEELREQSANWHERLSDALNELAASDALQGDCSAKVRALQGSVAVTPDVCATPAEWFDLLKKRLTDLKSILQVCFSG